MRYLLPLLLILHPAFAVAEDEVQLKVRPVLCIIDERTPSCQMSFLVLWESAETGYYCLYNDFEESALRCWADKRSGELNDERTVQTDFSYWMTGNDDESLLAMVAVEVLRMDTGDRRRKRRNRHVWDIF
jgi:hypothetical protein